MDLISIVVPCFNEQEYMPILYDEINKIEEKMKDNANFEIIFVDDGSTDNTLQVAKNLNKVDKKS